MVKNINQIPVGLLIYQTHRAIHLNINQAFFNAGIPIGIEQWQVMMELYNLNGLSQQFLANKTRKDKTTLARLISTLEKNGLVERKSDPSDKRKKLIFYTVKAFKLKEKIIIELKNFNKRLLKNIRAEEEVVLRNVINEMFKNLDWTFEYMNIKE